MAQDSLAILLGRLFIERRDVKAVQLRDGSYTPDQDHVGHPPWECPGGCEYRRWTMGDLRAHLAGERTLGHYLVSPEGRARVFAYDIDLIATDRAGAPAGEGTTEEAAVVPINPRDEWLKADSPYRGQLTVQLRCMAEALALRVRRVLDLPVAISYSGHKGLHVYGLTGSEDAEAVRGVAVELLEGWGCFELVKGKSFYRHVDGQYKNLSIEVFPKQTEVAEGHFGNLLRLPMGVHRRTGRPAFFVDVRRPYSELHALAEPISVLEAGDPWLGDSMNP